MEALLTLELQKNRFSRAQIYPFAKHNHLRSTFPHRLHLLIFVALPSPRQVRYIIRMLDDEPAGRRIDRAGEVRSHVEVHHRPRPHAA